MTVYSEVLLSKQGTASTKRQQHIEEVERQAMKKYLKSQLTRLQNCCRQVSDKEIKEGRRAWGTIRQPDSPIKSQSMCSWNPFPNTYRRQAGFTKSKPCLTKLSDYVDTDRLKLHCVVKLPPYCHLSWESMSYMNGYLVG